MPNSIGGHQPKYDFGFNDTGLQALTISSNLRRNEFYHLGANEITAAGLDGQAKGIKLNLASYHSLREVLKASIKP